MRLNTLITGGTGFIGRQLVQRLGGAEVVTRDPARAARQSWPAGTSFISWRDQNHPLELPADYQPDAVVNLMGESIASRRWNKAFKEQLRTSRIAGTQQLVAGILATRKLPRVMVSASAIGYYGDRGEEFLTESASPGDDFLARLSIDWEEATRPLREAGVRVVHLRIGIVLGRDGGALEKMLPLFRWGLGGRLGNGRQWFPWIHELDVVELIAWLLEESQVSGPVNAVAPGIVTNRDFTRELAKQLNRPAIFPAPRFGLRLAIGEFADSLLASSRVVPKVALDGGYAFRFPSLPQALQDVLS